MIATWLIWLLLAAPEGRPLFYWGARPPVILGEGAGKGGVEAQVTEVHGAIDRGNLVLRFTFDRPVRSAIYLPGGKPVSGRLRAVLYLDTDDDRETGFAAGAQDLRTGADRRLEIGVLYLGEDPEEQRLATALVTARLALLKRDGGRRTLWRSDDSAAPRNVSAHGPWVEVRLPVALGAVKPKARLILAGERTLDGRLR